MMKKSKSQGGHFDMGMEMRRPFTSPGAMQTSSTPTSPISSVSPGGTHKKKLQKGNTQKLDSSLPSLLLVPDGSRPGSASSKGSKGSKGKEEGSKKNAFVFEDDDNWRTEKPLSVWAMDAGVPLDIATQAMDTFLEFVNKPPPPRFRVTREQLVFGRPFDARYDLGAMDVDHFGLAILRVADAKDFSALPPGFLEKAMMSADKDDSGDIDFCEFLYFYYKFCFSEEVLIGPEERQIRLAAREHNIPYDDMGKYKYVFDQTDTNKNGRICLDEFLVLVEKLLKVPAGEHLPAKRSKDLWREATRPIAGKDLDFISFVGWYKRYFMQNDPEVDETPFEAYYHNVRRVSVYDSNAWH